MHKDDDYFDLVRGSVVDWYPYPFVDVARDGYGGVLLRGLVFLAAFGAAGAAFATATNLLRGT